MKIASVIPNSQFGPERKKNISDSLACGLNREETARHRFHKDELAWQASLEQSTIWRACRQENILTS